MTRSLTQCLAILLCIAFAPPVTAQSVVAQTSSREKVYLLRGFMNVFSPGLDQFADELRQRNIEATVANNSEAAALAASAIQDCNSGRVSSIVIIGHSAGARAALDMAERLRQAGIRVALVVTLDPVVTLAAPGNVRRLENFYLSNGWGKPVQRDARFRGSLQNADLKGDPELGHVSLTTSPVIHQRVLRSVAAAAGNRCR
ncbi:MAG: hypothetical protein HXX15_21535 [Rhodopseudomonas sp.]|uniref:thioesterase domain-containing protein n=1 Tax=Rhodopseudomonas sp. TaxID=1078 RepID=UPI00184EA132|nr:thioesterase domain-containing protein [Rhodopseudomonas sp.]NVN88671.1 hypothetical protein [Rhodopseudomonas sp.]